MVEEAFFGSLDVQNQSDPRPLDLGYRILKVPDKRNLSTHSQKNHAVSNVCRFVGKVN